MNQISTSIDINWSRKGGAWQNSYQVTKDLVKQRARVLQKEQYEHSRSQNVQTTFTSLTFEKVCKLYEGFATKGQCDGLWILAWILCRKSTVWLRQIWPDLNSGAVTAKNRPKYIKKLNWLPAGYWKHHLWHKNIVVQKVILCSLMQFLALSQICEEIHLVI